MHVGTNAYVPPGFREKRVNRDETADYAASATTIQRTLVDLMCRGPAERFPTMNWVVGEFNAG